MNKTKHILYLSHRIPFPPNKGDKIRSFNEIKFLSQHHTLDLIALADDPEDMAYEKALEKYCRHVKIISLNQTAAKLKGGLNLISGKSITQGYFYQKQMQRTYDSWIQSNDYDVIFCFSSPMAEYIFNGPTSLKKAKSVTCIMDFCDLDSDKWLQYSLKKPFPVDLLFRMEGNRLLEFEKKINQRFDDTIFVSHGEARLFRNCFPGAQNVRVIPNGVDYDYFSSEKVNSTHLFPSPMIMFSGAMDYYANIDGVTWFAKEIFPFVKKRMPRIEFFIVGRNPDPGIKRLEKYPGITVTGFVDDIRPYYKAADICIIPLRVARGVQNKVLESMAMAKPVVATSIAIQGIKPDKGKDVAVADTEQQFSDVIIKLLTHPTLKKQLGINARKYVVVNHNWISSLKGILDFRQ